ncbi:hypothetical protein QZH41_004307 [Actinostola sp. cb2023]|nr:hypothetical protein QZH41_004307 [Actinostola sp. cb2023]
MTSEEFLCKKEVEKRSTLSELLGKVTNMVNELKRQIYTTRRLITSSQRNYQNAITTRYLAMQTVLKDILVQVEFSSVTRVGSSRSGTASWMLQDQLCQPSVLLNITVELMHLDG